MVDDLRETTNGEAGVAKGNGQVVGNVRNADVRGLTIAGLHVLEADLRVGGIEVADEAIAPVEVGLDDVAPVGTEVATASLQTCERYARCWK